jgi:hypothetical protein
VKIEPNLQFRLRRRLDFKLEIFKKLKNTKEITNNYMTKILSQRDEEILMCTNDDELEALISKRLAII